MRRLSRWATALVAAASLGVAAPILGASIPGNAGTATAATAGYPPHTGGGSGSVTVGGTTSTSECGFAPGTTVEVYVNGVPYATFTVGPTGCLNLIISARVVGGQVQISINGDPWVNANCGSNVLTSVGTAPDGAPFTFTFVLTVGPGTCTTAVVTPSSPSSGVSSSSGVSPTSSGAATSPSSSAATTGPSSGLAFTGSDIALTTIGGLVLIALGTLILLAVRRRRHAET